MCLLQELKALTDTSANVPSCCLRLGISNIVVIDFFFAKWRTFDNFMTSVGCSGWLLPFMGKYIHFYRASICEGGLGSCNSVCPSVTRWIVTKLNDTLQIFFIPHERAITLLLWHQQWLMGDAPFPLKSALKVTHPLRKTPTSTDFRL